MIAGQLVWHQTLGLGKVIVSEPGPQNKTIIKVAFLHFWPLVECSPEDIQEFSPSDELKLVINKLIRSEIRSG